MQQFRCTAVLFDLDGVLVDSTASVARQWRLWAAENALDPDAIINIAHGRRTIEVVRMLMPQLDAEAEVKKIEKREADDIEGVSVMPGAADLVYTLPENQWGVVTSGTAYLATSRLLHAGLCIPRVLVSADDVAHGKPHPEPYLKGAQLLGAAAADCLVIEDAPAGVHSAHAAGMKAISLTSTYSAADLAEADALIQSLGQIHVGLGGTNGIMLLEVFGR
jgi:mannitol-1-/sugar-/sorbitol-6-phosphatase